jgi:hypothetical protein
MSRRRNASPPPAPPAVAVPSIPQDALPRDMTPTVRPGAPRMPGRLLAQLGWVMDREAVALRGWWGKPRVSMRDYTESNRLEAMADEVFERARAAGLDDDEIDLAFGGDLRLGRHPDSQ